MSREGGFVLGRKEMDMIKWIGHHYNSHLTIKDLLRWEPGTSRIVVMFGGSCFDNDFILEDSRETYHPVNFFKNNISMVTYLGPEWYDEKTMFLGPAWHIYNEDRGINGVFPIELDVNRFGFGIDWKAPDGDTLCLDRHRSSHKPVIESRRRQKYFSSGPIRVHWGSFSLHTRIGFCRGPIMHFKDVEKSHHKVCFSPLEEDGFSSEDDSTNEQPNVLLLFAL